ncbi:hypothetical protein [Dictyobacter aurantiacus]|uniref:hypothetical protein n=1 Tax=Dictyobacter aurantiacus TaxID=1936993 RepID=UPI000F840C4C|nr:hypothetical protein [Dictyobacter aurantiacus]
MERARGGTGPLCGKAGASPAPTVISTLVERTRAGTPIIYMLMPGGKPGTFGGTWPPGHGAAVRQSRGKPGTYGHLHVGGQAP